MTSTEAIFHIVVGSLLLGGLITLILVDIFSVRPLQRKLIQERSRRRYDRRINAIHQGTPYLLRNVRTTAPENGEHPDVVWVDGSPGLRLVNGQPMYSADFLNDEPVAR